MWLGDNDIFTEENYKGGGCDSVIVELANGLQCGAMVVLCFTKSNVREDKINAEMAAVLLVTISQGLRKNLVTQHCVICVGLGKWCSVINP